GGGVHRHRGRSVVDPATAGAVVAGGQAEGHGAVARRHRLAQGRSVVEDVRETGKRAARRGQRHEGAKDRPHGGDVVVGRRGGAQVEFLPHVGQCVAVRIGGRAGQRERRLLRDGEGRAGV